MTIPHRDMNRNKAETILKGKATGSYLFRRSPEGVAKGVDWPFVLSIKGKKDSKQFLHWRMKQTNIDDDLESATFKFRAKLLNSVNGTLTQIIEKLNTETKTENYNLGGKTTTEI